MKNIMIDNLLEKYWMGETSLEEEKQLRTFFQSSELSENYEALRPLFVGTEVTEMPEISAATEAKWLKTFDQLEGPAKQEGKVISMQPKRNWFRVAAVAIILLATGYFIYNNANEYEDQQYAETMEAYEETKRALAMVGIHFEKGKDKTAIGINTVSRNLEIIQTK